MEPDRLIQATVGFALLSALVGCGSVRKAVDSIGKWDAEPITTTYAEEVDLLVLLTAHVPSSQSLALVPSDSATYGQRLEKALADADNLNNAGYVALRRSVVEALVRRSNRLCHVYKQDMVRKQARGNFLFGTTALLLGTTGAVVTHAATARALSGAGAFATGTQSELNQDFYLDKTAAIVAKAIDKKRDIQWRIIQANMDVAKHRYTLRGAIMDVEDYHYTCSLTGAVAELEKAVDRIDVLQSVEAAASAAARFAEVRKTLSGGDAAVPAVAASAAASAPS